MQSPQDQNCPCADVMNDFTGVKSHVLVRDRDVAWTNSEVPTLDDPMITNRDGNIQQTLNNHMVLGIPIQGLQERLFAFNNNTKNPDDQEFLDADLFKPVTIPIQGSTDGAHGGPLANNNNNNSDDEVSLEDEEPADLKSKDKAVLKFMKATSTQTATAVIVFNMGAYFLVHSGYIAIKEPEKICMLVGIVVFMLFSIITAGMVHSLEGRANDIDLATTMVLAEITYAILDLCIASMFLGKIGWFTVVTLLLIVLVVWLSVAYWFVLRYRRPGRLYTLLRMLKKRIFSPQAVTTG